MVKVDREKNPKNEAALSNFLSITKSKLLFPEFVGLIKIVREKRETNRKCFSWRFLWGLIWAFENWWQSLVDLRVLPDILRKKSK